jgi:hypothetical protein
MGEDGRAVALHMLIEPDARAGLGHDRCERGLAHLKRIAAEIVAVQFEVRRPGRDRECPVAKTTVIFWTGDLRVTASARIV